MRFSTKDAQGITGPVSLREYLGINLREMGEALGRHSPNGRRGRSYSRQHVKAMESYGREVTAHCREAYAAALGEAVHVSTKGEYVVELNTNRREWRVKVLRRCDWPECGRLFVQNSPAQKYHSARCREQHHKAMK